MDTFHDNKFQLNNFETIVSLTWRSLQIEEDLHDVIIACDDTEITAHKVILSSNSPILKTIFSKNRHLHPVIYLRGVKHKELSQLIDFIYQGEVNIDQTTINEFLYVAEDLKIRGFTQSDREKDISLAWSEPKLSCKLNNEDKLQNKNVVKEKEFVVIKEKEIAEKQDFRSFMKKDNAEESGYNYDLYDKKTNTQVLSMAKNLDIERFVEDGMKEQLESHADPKNYENVSLLSKSVQDKEVISKIDHQLERGGNLNKNSNESFVWKYFDCMEPPGNTLKNAFVKCSICPKKIQSFTSKLIDHISQHRVKGEIANGYTFIRKKSFHANETSNQSKRDMIETKTKFALGNEKSMGVKDIANPIEMSISKDKDFVDSERKLGGNILNSYSSILATDESKMDEYSCGECNFKTTKLDAMKKHFQDIHENLANNELKRKVYLQLKSCDKCEYTPKNRRHLKEHKEAVHSGIRYPCDMCNYEAQLQRGLKVHKEFKHEGISYPCDMCKYQSPTQPILKKHKERCLERSKEKKPVILYPCDICQFESKRQKILENHKKIKH